MNKQIAMKWVKALRSGKYEQGAGELRNAYGAYCCLGILQGPVLGLKKLRHYGGMSEAACERAKMSGNGLGSTGRGGIGIQRKRFRNLAQANDYGITFSQIARWIERNWERL